MPPTRWPCGAPVPVGVAPTSRRRNAGGVKLMICQRSTLRGEAAGLHEGGRRRRVDDPARDGDVVLRALHLDLRLVDQRRVADRGLVHEGEMGEIEQVVDDELPVALDVEVLALRAPVRIVEPVEVGDLVGIGERGIAHPDPQPVIALDHRIAFAPWPSAGSCPGPAPARRCRSCRSAGRGNGTAGYRRPACPSTAAGGGARSGPRARPACRPRGDRTRSARRE